MARAHPSLLLALAASWSAGCGPQPLSVYLPLPPEEGQASALLAIEQGGTATVLAADLAPDRAAFELSAPLLGVGASAQLSALLYRERLADLYLAAGDVPRASPLDPAARPLPPTSARWVTELDLASDAAPAWRPLGAWSRALADYRLPAATTRCAEFEVEGHTLETDGTGNYLVQVGPKTVLAGTRLYANGSFRTELWRIDLDGSHRPVEVYDEALGQPSTTPILGLHADGDDLWLGGAYGELDRAVWDGERVVLRQRFYSPAGGTVHWITGHTEGTQTDLYLLTVHGAFSRFDGRSFTRLHQLVVESEASWFGGLAHLGAGEALAALGNARSVIRSLPEGGVREERVPADGAFHAVARVPGLGAVLANSEGHFLRSTEVGWEYLPGSALTVWALALLPYEDGFVYSGAFNNFGQYTPSHAGDGGFCPISMPTGFDVRAFAALGDHLVMVGDNPKVSQSPYRILRRRR